ncbi:hypothetical protein OS175_07400 [Marinicella sp. S1101]|uniref:hypothetical protein n=1 Tax=Marinicella marina TaxID=2996016 RepID=UPI0022608A7D|nr:hypothetical protein [Marinicella marina]MCX7553700.1 hypothetical protein [Marinicella marina]MDJ1140790.1 hypothetical protein [Marinicella marina]
MTKTDKTTEQNKKILSLKMIWLAVILILGLNNIQAASVDTKGVGEVLLFPYYTVNNDINTSYALVNTSNQAKSIKVRFLEGDNNIEVLVFNVYLSPFDVWVGTLSPTISTIAGHIGEPSVLHSTDDNSCAPYLNKAAQEFLPFAIDNQDLLSVSQGNNSMERSTEGHIEVIEMGVVVGDSADAISHDANGIPNNCSQLEDAWGSGKPYWSIDPMQDLEPASGGLMGSATLLNINQGTAVSYDALAIDDFWATDAETHTEPGTLVPNLAQIDTETNVIFGDQTINSSWLSGHESISALLMQKSLFNQYDLFSFINASTEWVVSFPTKIFHTNNQIIGTFIPPFSSSWNGLEACETVSTTVWDNSQLSNAPAPLDLCQAVNVIEFKNPSEPANTTSAILGSTNLVTSNSVNLNQAGQSGWMKLDLSANNQRMVDDNAFTYNGLPAMGFMVNRYTNAGAPVGVLAQYSGLYMHTTQKSIQPDIIFKSTFE